MQRINQDLRVSKYLLLYALSVPVLFQTSNSQIANSQTANSKQQKQSKTTTGQPGQRDNSGAQRRPHYGDDSDHLMHGLIGGWQGLSGAFQNSLFVGVWTQFQTWLGQSYASTA